MTTMDRAFHHPQSGQREQVSTRCRSNRCAAVGPLGGNRVRMGARAAHVGRVGGLAVALGVGAAVLTGLGCGVAWADTSESAPSSSSDSAATKSRSASPEASRSRTRAAGDADQAAERTETPKRRTSAETRSARRGVVARSSAALRETAAQDPAAATRLPKADSRQRSDKNIDISASTSLLPTESTHGDTKKTIRFAAHGPAQRQPRLDGKPTTPVDLSPLSTLLAAAGRESQRTFLHDSPTLNPMSVQVTNELATPATFTGEPSMISRLTTGVFRAVRVVMDVLRLDFVTDVGPLISSANPPWFTTLGLNVRRSEFEGMPVWTLEPPNPSGKYVVGIHGGAYVVEPSVFEWIGYASWARDTGATVIMPIYPLAPQGTAGTVVPVIAHLISYEIDQQGAENVSVAGGSAGGGIALTAVQELVRRGDPVPSHMVLLSPALDLTFSNPAIQFVDDPILTDTTLRRGQQWAGDLALDDPLVSPLYGSLAGLPPTAIYSGNLDLLSPDVLVLQDKALATPGSDFTFILRNGELHGWAGVFWLPEARAAKPDIYRQLGIGSEV